MSLQCRVPADWMADPSLCWFEWQTLIGSFFAIVVGIVTICFLKRQIQQTSEIADAGRVARLTVARAKLPLAASETAAHATRCISALNLIEPAIQQRLRSADPVHIDVLDPSVICIFDALLAETQDKNALFAVSAIYAEQQVFMSRMSDIHQNPQSHALAIDAYFLQPIIMHALAMTLLTYGRRESSNVDRVGWDEIAQSARNLLTRGVVRERILTMIADKSQRGVAVPYALSETQ